MGDDLFLRIRLQVQDAASQAVKALGGNMEALASVSKLSMGDVGKAAQAAGLDISKLSTLEVKAAESAKRLDVSHAQAALALKKSDDMAALGKASTEQLAVAQAQAAQAAERVNVSENALANALQKVQTEADRLSSAMSGDAEKTNIFTRAAESAKNALGNIGSGAMGAAKGIWDFANKAGQAVFNLQNLYQGAVGLGQALIGSNASMEQTDVAFTQLLGSSSAAHAELKDLQIFAADTPFEFPDVAEATQKFLAFQIPLKDTKPLLTAIGDALSGLGKNTPATLEQVVDVFGQMNAAGKIQTQDLMQLTSVGINGFQLLADQMHKPVATIKDMVTNGTIPATKGIEMLRAGMEKTFGGGMQAQSKTFNGLLSTFSDNAQSALRAFTGPLFDMAKDSLTKLGDAVSSKAFQDFATTTGKQIGDILKSIGDALKSVDWGAFVGNLVFLGQQLGIVTPSANQTKTAIGDIGTALKTAVTDVGNFARGLGDVVKWFRDGSVPAQIVEDLLIGIGVALALIGIGAFVMALPALIGGFIAWGIAAGGAAIAQLALIWPLLLIGAVIALVVAAIILAVQHWGDITKFLQGAWAAFSSWFMGAIHAIGNFFVGVWNGIISFLHAAWGVIINIIKIGAMVALAVLFLPIVLMVAAFIWLYNHNYYFKMLVDAIIGFFVGCFNWCRDNWQGFINFLGGLWNGFVGIASAVWGAVSGAVMAVVGFVVGWLRGQWSATIAVLGAIWGTLFGIAQGAWDKVTGVFRGAWGMISGALSGLWNSLVNWFNGWPSQFLAWGGNVIASFIQGIKDKIAGIGTALAGAAETVKNFLGFHSPTKEGPGAEADQWAPNFVKMYAKGLTDNLPLIQSAVNKLSTPIGISALKSSNTSISNSFVGKGSSSSSGGSAGGPVVVHQTFNINVTTQGGWSRAQVDDLTKQVEDKLSRKLRGSGVFTTQTSGGAQ